MGSKFANIVRNISVIGLTSFILGGCGPARSATRSTPQPTQTALPTAPLSTRTLDQTDAPSLPSESALLRILEQGELRIGVLYNYPPFSYRVDNGTLRGYEIELANKIAEKWGVTTKFVQVTRQTRVPFLLDGTVDMIMGAVPHLRSSEQYMEFSNTTFMSGSVAMVSNDSGIESITQIGTTTIGVVGSEMQNQLGEYMALLGQSPHVILYGSVDEAVAAYQAGSIGSIVGRREDLMRATSILQNEKILGEFITAEPYAIAVRRGDAPLRDLVNLTLQDIAKSGQLGELFNANLYGYADNFVIMQGETAIDTSTFPKAISSGESVVARLRRGEPLRVAGLSLSQATLSFDSQTIVDGYDRAVLNEMARRWNVPLIEIPQSVGDAGVQMLQAGQADLVMSIVPNVALIGRLGMSQPYYVRAVRMIHLQAITIYGIDDLNYKDVAVIDPADVSADLVNKNSEFATVETFVSGDEAFLSLAAGSIYAIIGDEYATFLMAKADTRMVVFPRRFRPREFVLGYAPNDADFSSLVNFTLQDMQADGTLDRLISQYFGPYTPPDEPPDRIVLERWPGPSNFLGVGGY